MFSRAECPAILIDRQQHIVASNRRGGELLSAGAFVSAVDGRLVCPDDVSQRALMDALAAGSSGAEHSHTMLRASKSGVLRRGSARQLGVSLSAFAPFGGDPAHGGAMVLLTFENAPLESFDLLGNVMHCFGLTSAQGRVAVELATGKTIKQAAFYLGVSVNTVRHHVKAIFAKTGTNRQVELVRMLGRLSQMGTLDEESERMPHDTRAAESVSTATPMPRPTPQVPETIGGVAAARQTASGEMPAH